MQPASASRGHLFLVGAAERTARIEQILDAHPWEYTRSDAPVGALRRLRSDSAVDVVVLMPDEAVDKYTELCRDIKFDGRTALTSVVFVLPSSSAEVRTDIYKAGADDCTELPVTDTEIVLRLSNALRLKRATNTLEDSTAVITSLATAIEGRDSYTHGHVERVSTYAMEIGRRL